MGRIIENCRYKPFRFEMVVNDGHLSLSEECFWDKSHRCVSHSMAQDVAKCWNVSEVNCTQLNTQLKKARVLEEENFLVKWQKSQSSFEIPQFCVICYIFIKGFKDYRSRSWSIYPYSIYIYFVLRSTLKTIKSSIAKLRTIQMP